MDNKSIEEYEDEELIEYFKEFTGEPENPKYPNRAVRYDKSIKVLNVHTFNIKPEKYSEFLEKLKRSGYRGKLNFICYKDNEEHHDMFDKFLKELEKFEKDFGIENISLEGNFLYSESNYFKKVKTIFLPEFMFEHINKFINKFPNLEMIKFQDYRYNGTKFGVDLEGLITSLKYVSSLSIDLQDVSIDEIKEEINNDKDLKDKILIFNDGKFFLNIEKKDERQFLTVSLNDLNSRLELLKKLNNDGYNICLSIPDASMLTSVKAQELMPIIKRVEVYSPKSKDSGANCKYGIEQYIAIRKKIDELVEGIDINLPEKERFAEVYYRICKNIIYDYGALTENANTKEEKEYAEKVQVTCRNLENGLLYGKCVCAGYAEILRNALFMVNIENVQIGGSTPRDAHAWNKVKLDGIWYNVDATWDATNISRGILPSYCCKSDEYIKANDEKDYFSGPECVENMELKEIEKLFGKRILQKGSFNEYFSYYFNRIQSFFKNQIISRIFTNKKKQEFLPDIIVEPAAKDNKSTENSSWDLENYGISKKEINQKIKDSNNSYKDIQKIEEKESERLDK